MPSDSIRRRAAFMLLEVVIAVGIFAFAVVGLAIAMNRIIDVELVSRSEQRLRLEVQSRLAEARLEPFEEGTIELAGGARGIAYFRVVERLELENRDGELLDGLFTMRVEARSGGEVVQTAEVIVNENARF